MAPSLREAGEEWAAATTLAAFVTSALILAATPAAPAEVPLRAQAESLAGELEDELGVALALVAPLRARLHTGEPLDWKSFDGAFTGSTTRRPAEELIVWAPRVVAPQRAAFEADSGRDAFRSWRIVEPDADGRLAAAPARPVHHPISLAAPLAGSAGLLGLDLDGMPELEAALAAPGRAARPAVVGPLTLLPAATCADRRRLGCRPQIFLILPEPRGAILVGVSWAAITAGARTDGNAPRRLANDLPRSRAARAQFQLLGDPWSLELWAPPGGSLSARLGPARAPGGTSRGN
jgi:hypothetical protein